MESIEIQIKNNAPQAANEFKSLREQVKEARTALKDLEVGSDEYSAAIQRLANVTHEYRDEQEIIKNSAGDLGTVLANTTKVASDIAAGFSSVAAIESMFGKNTEDVQKAMLKLQQGMALVQGLKGLEGMGKESKNLITSLKSLKTSLKGAETGAKGFKLSLAGIKTAIAETGIGLLVIALAELIAHWEQISDAVTGAKKKLDAAKESFEKNTIAVDDHSDALEFEVKKMEASGAAAVECAKQRVKNLEVIIAETDALIKNTEEDLRNLKQKKRWFDGNAKLIKELDEELKQLNEKQVENRNELTKLQQTVTLETIKENKKQTDDAKKSAEERAKAANKAAADQKAALKKSGEDFKAYCDKLVADYRTAMSDISNIRNTLTGSLGDTNKIKEVTDVEAWIQVFGTDPKQLDSKLSGVATELGRNLRNGLYDELTKRIEGQDAEKVKALTKEYYQTLVDAGLENAEDLSVLVDNLVLAPAMKTANSIESVASSISEEFTSKFNSLNKLYDEGIVDYKEYYDTLLNIQDEYQVAVADFRNMYIDEEKMSAERVAQLEYAMQIKPLATQKEVSEKFMNQLDADIAAIEGMFNASNTESYNRYWDAVYGNYKDKKTGAMADRDQWKVSVREMRDLSIQYANETYEAENKRIEQERSKIQEQLANNELTAEAKQELNDQLAQLNADQETNEQQHVETMTAIQDEFLASIEAQVTGMVDAFSGLSDSFANIAGAMVDRYEWMYENEEMTEEEFKKKKKQALKAQAAFNIASAIMDTGAGITKVWMHAADLGPIAGPIAAGVQTAAYLANLTAQIISINTGLKKGLAEDNSGTSGGSSGVDASATVLNSDSYANILSDTTNTELQKNAQDNVKVFVLESDISDRQNSARTTVSTSTF